MNRLPPGWAESTLGAVCDSPQYGWTTSARKDGPAGLKFLRTTDISRGVLDWGSVPLCENEPTNPERYQLSPGDIVISRAGSVGLSYRLTDVVPAVFASYLIRFRPSAEIDGQYVAYYLRSRAYWSQIAAATSGITLANVNAKKLSAIRLPLAPRAEQGRIVAAIEEQFSRLGAGVAALERVRQNLKRLRSAVLGAAVTGRLGEGAKPEAQHEGTPRLPEGWEVKQLRSLCQLENGDRSRNYPSKRYRVEAGIPFINAGHLNNGTVTTDSMDYISRERFDLLSAGRVRDGDLLFCLRGSLGKAALVEGIGLGAIASSLVIVRPTAAISGPYLLAYLLSPLAHEMIRKFDNGTAQPNLSAKDLGRFEVPVPDRAKQVQIVEELEAIQTAITDLEASCDLLRTREERVRSAILDAAFSGRLVPQDPNDEPASVLLELIGAEQTSANGHKTTSSRNPRTTRTRVLT